MKTLLKTAKNQSSESFLAYKRFQDFLLHSRKEKTIDLYFDIETLQYNEEQGRKKPTLYKNVTYSFAVSYFRKSETSLDDELDLVVFPNSYYFFELIKETWYKWKNNPKINLIAHNTNKYDNHFVRHELIYYYNFVSKNLFLRNATDEGNTASIKKGDLKKETRDGIILEKRVKSGNNLEMNFFMNRIEFQTIDNFVKTHTSLKTLGKKLLNIGKIKEEELKTEFDYTQYNRDYDMTDEEARSYALKVFHQLSDEEMTYIKNDVIILAKSVKYYSQIFKGFDYSKITFTSNIMEYFTDNDLASYQLLKSIGKGKDKYHLKYTDYKFANENLYDYLKPFYRGGLNMYNDKYVGKILNERLFSVDINSSYPYVMHNFKIPTFLRTAESFEFENKIKVDKNENYYYLYRMYKKTFDETILSRIESKVLRQMLVKYYTTNDFININSFTLKMLENTTGLIFDNIKVISYLKFECVEFGSKDKIAEHYYIKTRGSNKNKIEIISPYEMKILEEENDEIFTDEEINISKVYINGVYGIPALRPYFNIFKWVGNNLHNIPNGYKNNERNIVFSIFVTSVALYNLLSPFKNLTAKEIDDNFIYCDTDSLYLKYSIYHKMPQDIFDHLALGKWDIEKDNIKQFIAVNHKKYAYLANNKKGQEMIHVKCGGVPNDSFDTNMSFEKFVKTQFSEGVEIENTKGIYNQQGTISIYPSITKISIGEPYRLQTYDPHFDKAKEMMFDEIKKAYEQGQDDDILYIESSLGTFSFSDLYPITNETKEKQPIEYLILEESNMDML